jgi:hypothetical protein
VIVDAMPCHQRVAVDVSDEPYRDLEREAQAMLMRE